MRELDEETGYAVEPVRLLGIDSINRRYPRKLGRFADFQGLRIVYEGRITGGELRHETNGSTDLAAWHPWSASKTLNASNSSTWGLSCGAPDLLRARRTTRPRTEPGLPVAGGGPFPSRRPAARDRRQRGRTTT